MPSYTKDGFLLPPKMTTAEYRLRLRDLSGIKPHPSKERPVCWEAALDAFGVEARTGKPEFTDVILRHLRGGGWDVRRLSDAEIAPVGIVPTLAVFMQRHDDVTHGQAAGHECLRGHPEGPARTRAAAGPLAGPALQVLRPGSWWSPPGLPAESRACRRSGT
jgi:hypothetical protein